MNLFPDFLKNRFSRIARIPTARVLRRAGLLPHLNIHETMIVNGRKITIPLKGEVGIQHGWSTDAAIITVYERLLALKSGGFIDVGANIGQTMIKLKTLDPQRSYFGFEPNPICVDYLATLKKVNGFTKCDILPTGLSNQTGVARLFLNEEADTSATVIEDFRPGAPITITQYISTSRLDDLYGPLGIRDIAIMKIDVEGFELEVIKGAMQFLQSERPFVVCEILPVYDAASEIGKVRTPRQNELLGCLKELDYGIARVGHTDASLTPIENIEVHSNLGMCDYVFFPEETRSQLGIE